MDIIGIVKETIEKELTSEGFFKDAKRKKECENHLSPKDITDLIGLLDDIRYFLKRTDVHSAVVLIDKVKNELAKR